MRRRRLLRVFVFSFFFTHCHVFFDMVSLPILLSLLICFFSSFFFFFSSFFSFFFFFFDVLPIVNRDEYARLCCPSLLFYPLFLPLLFFFFCGTSSVAVCFVVFPH